MNCPSAAPNRGRLRLQDCFRNRFMKVFWLVPTQVIHIRVKVACSILDDWSVWHSHAPPAGPSRPGDSE